MGACEHPAKSQFDSNKQKTARGRFFVIIYSILIILQMPRYRGQAPHYIVETDFGQELFTYIFASSF
jgi:hypothetical protein